MGACPQTACSRNFEKPIIKISSCPCTVWYVLYVKDYLYASISLLLAGNFSYNVLATNTLLYS